MIAESIRTTDLVERRARPHPAGQCLVEKPAIEEKVDRTIGCLYLHCPEGVAPECSDRKEDRVEVDGAEARDQRLRFLFRCCVAAEDDDLCLLVRPEVNPSLHGTTWIKAGTDPIRQWRITGEGSRTIECAIAAHKFLPVSGPAHLAPGKISERDTMREFRSPWIPCEHRSRRRIDLCRDERNGDVTKSGEHPFHVGGDRKPPASARFVCDLQL